MFDFLAFWSVLMAHNIYPYCEKSVRIRSYWSFSGLYFLAFKLNAEKYAVSLRVQSECGKIRTRKTPNTDIFHAVSLYYKRTLTETVEIEVLQ